MTLLLDEIAMAAARLAQAGVESPRTDAELIAAHLHDVPRPETEVMTGWAVEQLAAMDVAEPVVADLGTGSGAIALAIAQEVPRARVHAVETDPLAAQWAQRNIDHLATAAPHTAGRVTLHAGDFAAALTELDGAVDLVVSNPPYIPLGSWVPPEVGEYDPATALWSGTDGLDAVRVIERTARRLLRPGGLVAVEHGAPQGAAVYWVFAEDNGWRDQRNHTDLAGRDRFVTAVWPGPPAV
jgi:release factor glutamine methyltransferase